MARRRERLNNVICPVCGSVHVVKEGRWLHKADAVWLGRITSFWCDALRCNILKLYGEDYRYVCWQQNARSEIPDYDEIPF